MQSSLAMVRGQLSKQPKHRLVPDCLCHPDKEVATPLLIPGRLADGCCHTCWQGACHPGHVSTSRELRASTGQGVGAQQEGKARTLVRKSLQGLWGPLGEGLPR